MNVTNHIKKIYIDMLETERLDLELNQTEFADELGISTGLYNNLKNKGGTFASLDRISMMLYRMGIYAELKPTHNGISVEFYRKTKGGGLVLIKA